MFWIGGIVQNANEFGNTNNTANVSVNNPSRTAAGGDVGIKLDVGQLSIVGSGYFDKGVGTTLMFTTTSGFDAVGNGRNSFGYLGQITYKIDPKWLIGASLGVSNQLQTNNDRANPAAINPATVTAANPAGYPTEDNLKDNLDGTAMLTYLWTKSLRFVLEYDYLQSVNWAFATNKQNEGSAGFMLFF
jgi:hypothetical protein